MQAGPQPQNGFQQLLLAAINATQIPQAVQDAIQASETATMEQGPRNSFTLGTHEAPVPLSLGDLFDPKVKLYILKSQVPDESC